jgi:MSHA pilin protein MshD
LDYNGFNLSAGDSDLGNGFVTVPAGYAASVTVTPDNGFGTGGSTLPQSDVVRITVTVTYQGGSVVLDGYRTKYAPTVTS